MREGGEANPLFKKPMTEQVKSKNYPIWRDLLKLLGNT